MVLVIHLSVLLPPVLGKAHPPIAWTITTLTANRHLVFSFLEPVYFGFVLGVGALALMFLFQRVVRIAPLTHLVSFLFFGSILTAGTVVSISPEGALFTLIWYLILIRVGVLAASTSIYIMQVLLALPLTLDMHAWYAERTLIAFGLLGAMLVWAFWISLGGKSPIGTTFFDQDD
jgi:hypothetical protein